MIICGTINAIVLSEMESQRSTRIAAFTVWNNRISPVFDTSRYVHIVVVEEGRILRENQEFLSDDNIIHKVRRIIDLGVDDLICGAISRSIYYIAQNSGINIIPFVSGALDDVIQGWMANRLNSEIFAMPGCWRQEKGRHQGREINNKEYSMQGKGSGGGGRSKGMGQGGGMGRGQGRGNNPVVGDNTGYCECPKCGHREAHERGIPCFQKQCPNCKVAMIRSVN